MKHLRHLILAAAGTLALAGCVVEPAYPYYGARVTVAPPAPRVEVIGAAPVAGYVWTDGYWNWGGGGHVWVPGRWVAPHPGYYWEPHRWMEVRGGWRLAPGHWVRGRR